MTTAEMAGADTFPKLLARHAAVRGARPAFRHKDLGIWQTWTWAEVNSLVRAYALGLSRLGLKREDRVAMIMLDTVDFPVLFWGAIRAGIIPVPLNPLLAAAQYRYILEDSRATVLFVSAALLPVARESSRM